MGSECGQHGQGLTAETGPPWARAQGEQLLAQLVLGGVAQRSRGDG